MFSGLRLEARGEGRALLVCKSATGEEIGIERSPEQLAELQAQLAALLPTPADPAPAGRRRNTKR